MREGEAHLKCWDYAILYNGERRHCRFYKPPSYKVSCYDVEDGPVTFIYEDFNRHFTKISNLEFSIFVETYFLNLERKEKLKRI